MSSVLNLWAGMTGTVLDFAGTTPPDGWLLCAGQTVSRTTYANLFAKIGTTFGVGDGSTTFHLPDGRGRVCAGRDDMGGSAAGRLTTAGAGVNGAALGGSGGSQTHILTPSQLAAHSHGFTDPGHAHALHTWNQTGFDGTGGVNFVTGDAPGSGSLGPDLATVGNVTGITIHNTGSDAAHNNTQPTIVFNKIIKI